MELIQIKQNFPSDYFRIDYTVGNICNYQCWYCSPESRDGSIKWPNFELIKKNLSFLLDYYLEHTNKKKFEIGLLGGEVTYWKEFIPFIEYFKKKYNCIFTLTTNGSKKLEWWEQAIPHLSQITLSHHQLFCDKKHLRDLADLIYKKNVLVNMSVLMDPTCWNECLDAVEYYKQSKYQWSITYVEVLQDKMRYTEEQRKLIAKVRERACNPFYYLKVNKTFRSKTTVIDSNNKTHKVSDNAILNQRLNHFEGWECSLGKEWLAIRSNGELRGVCSNKLFNQDTIYNIYNENFIEEFSPIITSTICSQANCWCGFEMNMHKKKINLSSQK
jgi:MoaA/NifB/PqqE/SkfB family radical SAM enzyme